MDEGYKMNAEVIPGHAFTLLHDPYTRLYGVECSCGWRYTGLFPMDKWNKHVDALPKSVTTWHDTDPRDPRNVRSRRLIPDATFSSTDKLVDHEEAIRHLLDHYYGPTRYFKDADIAIAKLAEVMGEE